MTRNSTGVELAVTFYNLELDQQAEERRWQGVQVEDRWVFKSVPPELDVSDQEVNYSINLWKEEDDEQARRAWEQAVADEAKTRAQWIELRPNLETLRNNGHFISSVYAAEGGKVEWTWSDTQTQNYETATISDYAKVKELGSIPYIPFMEFEGKFDSKICQYLMNTRHIGLLNIANSAGVDLSSLTNGPQIDSLSILDANSETIEGIAALSKLNTLEIWFREPAPTNQFPITLGALNRLIALKNLELWNVPGNSPDVLVGINALQSLKSLKINSHLGESSLRDVTRLDNLEQFDCLLDSPELITQIKNPKLRSLNVAYSSYPNDMDDNILLSWDRPASIHELSIRGFWTPMGHLAYVRALPEMLIEQRRLFARIRALPELKTCESDLESMRKWAIAIGGGLIDSVAAPEKATARQHVIDTLQLIEFNQENLRNFIPQMAKATLIDAKSLLDQKIISEKEMQSIIGALSPYYNEDDDEVWRTLHPEPITADPKTTQVLAAAMEAMGYNPATSNTLTYMASWQIERGPGSLPENRDLVINASSRKLRCMDSRFDFFGNRFVETVKLLVDGNNAVRIVHGIPSPSIIDKESCFTWRVMDLVPQMLAALSEEPERLIYLGQIKVDGKLVDRIQLLWHNKVTDEFDFDSITHLLVERRRHQTEEEKKMFDGKYAANGDYTWKYEKYERHAGLMIPMTITSYDPIGVSTEVRQCTAFAIAPNVPDSVFALP